MIQLRMKRERPRAEPISDAGIAIENVWASYGERGVLKEFDLEVERGTFVALAGPNGVGKSTLIRLVSGVINPTRGVITVSGIDVSLLSPRERARLVAVVPQDPELPRGAPALEVVLMGRNPHLGPLSWESEADVRIAVEAMRMTRAEDFLDRPVDELSGGERQRVAIAVALAQRTPIILLDEPTANLDLAYQPAIMELMRSLVSSGKTILAAVHDLTLAAQFCDKVALMRGGASPTVGSPKETLTEENIKRVYGANVAILPHPETGKPVIVNSWR